ncbi:MAG: segregation/condensation protein A [Eubacteriales bacterium]|nr:segregation/condensation protein A [Eubacteriales bacterium]
MAESVQFHLETFEGPLDLLLQLIHKNKVSIYDIPIAEILDQYMAILHEMQTMDMDVAGDFIAMAAQLMLIKSRMLLPKEEEENEEDPRAQLVEQLLEYQRIREVQPYFRRHSEEGRDVLTRPQEPLERKQKFEGKLPLDKLLRASQRMFDRVERGLPPSAESFQGIVGRERVPVHTKITSILIRFRRKASIRFRGLFDHAKSRSEIVATFLAVLELSKTRRLLIEGEGEDIALRLRTEKPEEETADDGAAL